jgi:photosystem II stability/assembly factor-like uncharacterized protein
MKMTNTILKISIASLLAALLFSSLVLAQGRGYTVQIASAPSETEARSLVADLKSNGIEAYWVKAEVPGKGVRYRVRIGRYKTQADAKAAGDRAMGKNLINEFIVTIYEAPAAVEKPKGETLEAEKPTIAKDKAPRPEPNKPETTTPTPTAVATTSKPVKEPAKEISEAPPVQTSIPSGKEKNATAPISAPTSEKATGEIARAEKPTAPESKPATPEPKATTPEPAIATPPVAEALADVAISNDNWKIVRRSAETDKNLRAIYFVDAITGWAAGDAGAVYRTTDGGRSWKPLLSGVPANINHIHFVDWNHGWMLGETNSRDDESSTLVFMTTNGGKTWSSKPLPNALSLHFTDPKNGWAVGKNATLLKTTDGGNEWKPVDSMEKLIGLPVESTSYNYGFRDIQFTDAQHGWLIGNFYGRARNNIGGVFTTDDGGVSWKRVPITIQTQFSSGRFTPGVYHSVKFTDVNTGSVTGEMYDGEGRFFFVLHTRDGGKTWEQFRTPSRATHSTQFLDLANGWTAAFAPREGGAEAVVYDTTLMRTDNGGMSWRNDFIAKGRRIRGVFFLSPTKGWAVGDRGMILRYEEKSKLN